jgi:hypothetical protein
MFVYKHVHIDKYIYVHTDEYIWAAPIAPNTPPIGPKISVPTTAPIYVYVYI